MFPLRKKKVIVSSIILKLTFKTYLSIPVEDIEFFFRTF